MVKVECRSLLRESLAWIAAASAVRSLLRSKPAHAQATAPVDAGWRNRPLHFVVPLAAGGGLDFVARLVAEYLSRSFSQPTVAELIQAVKERPGQGCANSGAGSNQHVLLEWFAQMSGARLDHVPYRGAGQAINDLVAGL